MKLLDENRIVVFNDAVIAPILPGVYDRLHYNRMRAVCFADGAIYIQRLDYDPYDDEEGEYVWRVVDDVPYEAYDEIRKAVQKYVRNR